MKSLVTILVAFFVAAASLSAQDSYASATPNPAQVAPLRVHCVRCATELNAESTHTDTLQCQERYFREEITANHYDGAIMWLLAEWKNYETACYAEVLPGISPSDGMTAILMRKPPRFEEFMERLVDQFPTLEKQK